MKKTCMLDYENAPAEKLLSWRRQFAAEITRCEQNGCAHSAQILKECLSELDAVIIKRKILPFVGGD